MALHYREPFFSTTSSSQYDIDNNERDVKHQIIISQALTHFILNRLSHTIYMKSPISILGISGYIMYIFLEKKAKLFANTGDPHQTPHSAGSDLGLHCLPITF